jgi:integrase
MASNSLTDVAVKQAEPRQKDYWMSDGGGLRLLVKANGTKCWRYNYRFGGKQKTLALGVYPDVSLKTARINHQEARGTLRKGQDPAEQKQLVKREAILDSALKFSVIAQEWWDHQKGSWTQDHANRVWARLKDNTFDAIGHKPITEIQPPDVIAIVRKIEQRGALDVAGRVLQYIRRVCRYAVQTGRLQHNPASELQDVLKSRKTSHRASLPREQLPQFLQCLEQYSSKGRLLTQLAIQLLVLTFVRPGELRGGRWEEFDLEHALWRIPGDRMKMGTEHLVPLSKQAMAVLERIREISGHIDLLFPSERNNFACMSDNTMRTAIFKMGYDGNTPGKSKVTPHGFRATASSILNETGFNPDAIERQLSHMERNGVRAAYTHHARYMEERTQMMQWWADYLDDLKESGKVIPIFARQN